MQRGNKSSLTRDMSIVKSSRICECELCEVWIKCDEQNIVYQFITCNALYIGATGRYSKDRILEHESLIRCRNNRYTIGQLTQTHGPETR